ncbi:hypothetical protein [Mangrovibacterium sp.]|uniref:hypothetical protein n=1 Tax=Mangrovibacterium sp. TaxID=1961364 RepID=UPI003566E90D
MRLLLAVLLCISVFPLFAQEDPNPQTVVFEGFLMLEDSIPIENAYLINYRTMKIVATNSKGYFKTTAQIGDSLMINHLTLMPKVVHVPEQSKAIDTIGVDYRTYMIEPVVSNSYAIQMKYFEKNMQSMYRQLEKLGYHPNISKSVRIPPYNPDEYDPGLTIRLGDLISLLKRKR